MDESTQQTNAYDIVPYKSYPFRQTHPERLATVGHLFGVDACPIDNCRVLELGCASGGNLLPMADRFPNSEFIGVDLSSRQIADGQLKVDRAGLKNVELINRDLSDLDDEFGKFDYIIAHGILSWIPKSAQQRMFELCGELLTDKGIAYISYNTYPGWRMRGMIRDVMAYRTRNIGNPQDRVRQARNLLHFLSESVPSESNPYGMLLEQELKQLHDKEDYYLLHEHLEENNSPMYFFEFIDYASRCGLQYLGEADFSVMAIDNFRPETAAMLRNIASDTIEIEQYMDFVRNRMFRQTLLCRNEVAVDRTVQPERLQAMSVASYSKVDGPMGPLDDGEQVTFVGESSTTRTSDPFLKAALLHLSKRWPEYVPFNELLAIARSSLTGGTDIVDRESISAEAHRIAKPLLRCYSTGQVELSICPPNTADLLSETPEVSRLTRTMAEVTHEVSNLRHESTRLTGLEQRIVPLLDGKTDRSVVVKAVCEALGCRDLIVHRDGKAVDDESEFEGIASESVDRALAALLQKRLLVRS